jgi:hypothetical protein
LAWAGVVRGKIKSKFKSKIKDKINRKVLRFAQDDNLEAKSKATTRARFALRIEPTNAHGTRIDGAPGLSLRGKLWAVLISA